MPQRPFLTMPTKDIQTIREALENVYNRLNRTGGIAPVLGPQNLNEVKEALSLLSSLETPTEPVKEECATKAIIGNVRERWEELGYNDEERAAERFRGQPWKAWYNGWIEGRWPLMVPAPAGGVQELIEAAGAVLNRWDSPHWEWAKHGHTASLIADLRKSVEAAKSTTPVSPELRYAGHRSVTATGADDDRDNCAHIH